MAGYKFKVSFEKLFIGGLLKGILHTNNCIKFCDWDSVEEFISSCDGKTITKVGYGTSNYVKKAPLVSLL